MATWNLHIVGTKAIEDVDAIAAEVVSALETKGHTLVSARLTTDDGTADLPVAPPADDTGSEQPVAEVPVDTPPQPVA